MFFQGISVVGAVLVLGAFGLLNLGKLRPTDISYSLINFVGAALLTWVAVVDRRAGFIILEATWALMSLIPLLRRPAENQGSTH